MSTPRPRALNFVAAVSTMRPSPEPRSTTKSFGPTSASFSIASTTAGGVGTYGPPVRSSSAPRAIVAHSNAVQSSSFRGNFTGRILQQKPVMSDG